MRSGPPRPHGRLRAPGRRGRVAPHAAAGQPAALALPGHEQLVLVRDAGGHRLELGEHRLQGAQPGRVVGGHLGGQGRARPPRPRAAGAVRCRKPIAAASSIADDAAREDELLGAGEPDERHEPGRADGRAHPRAGPHELEVVAAHPQVAARRDLGARADDVADAHGDAGRPDRVEDGVDPREGLHAGHRRRAVELLAHVGAGAERPGVGRGEHERAQAVVARQVGQRRLELGQLRRPERVARLRPVEPQHLDPVVAPLARQAAHGRASSRICGVKRLTTVLPAVLVAFLLLAPAALAHDGGEGTYGPAPTRSSRTRASSSSRSSPPSSSRCRCSSGRWTSARSAARRPTARSTSTAAGSALRPSVPRRAGTGPRV